MSTPVPLRSDFDTIGLRMLARRSRDPDQTRRLLALAEIYDGGSRRTRHGSAASGCRSCATGLLRFNAKGPDGLCERQSARRSQPPRRPSAPSAAAGRGRRPDSRRPWRRTLAADRSRAVALRRVPGLDLQADAQPRPAAHGLSQALSAAAPSCARRGSRRGFYKSFPAIVDEAAAQQASGKPTEIWFQDEARFGRRTRPPADGRNAGHGLRPRATRGRVGLYFRRHLPGRRKRRRARTTLLQQ